MTSCVHEDQKVVHKLTGRSMTVKKIFGSVAICAVDYPEFKHVLTVPILIDRVVCSVENLTPFDVKIQFDLFT